MPVTLSRKEWEGCLLLAGLTAGSARSQHLKDLIDALGAYEAEYARKGWTPFTELKRKFDAWDRGSHHGEHMLIKKTAEYAQLKRELSEPDPAPRPKGPPPLPPNRMLIAIWTCGHKAAWHKLGHAERHKQLDDVIKDALDQLAAIPGPQQTRSAVKVILAAPEYQYTAETDFRCPMTEAKKVLVEEQLRQKSEANPSILLIAGTSHYYKSEIRPAGAALLKVNPDTGVRDVPKGDVSRRERAKLKLEIAKSDAHVVGLGFLVDQGDVRRAVDGSGKVIHNVPALNKLGEELDKPASKLRFVRNVAYLFHAGRRMGKYDKQTDFSEAMNNSPDVLMFIPGTEKQCPEIANRRYGVEICYDHCNGVLARRNPGELQFHVVLSDWTNTRPGHMAMSGGGYYLHASTNGAESAVYRRPPEGGGPVKLTPTATKTIGTDKLDFYVIVEPSRMAVKASAVPSLGSALSTTGVGT